MSEQRPDVGVSRRLGALALAVVALAGCTSDPGAPAPTTTRGSSTSTTARGLPSPASAASAPTPVALAAGVPTEAELGAARAEVGRLDIRELAGQLVVARYAG
ncbi:MAG TPA: hypothetical protein VHM65_02185, partial [Candidatus Lustribacter sp.]|nr:hypothetical protein [Candidatus Lustribacter sp.]